MVNYTSARLDGVFAALADPTRRAILARLEGGERLVTELAVPFDMSLPAVSKHLTVLEHAGLLIRRRAGREVWCRLEGRPMRDAAAWLARYRRFWEERLDVLARYLDETEEEQPWPSARPPSTRRSVSSAGSRRRARRSSARGPTRRR